MGEEKAVKLSNKDILFEDIGKNPALESTLTALILNRFEFFAWEAVTA